MRCHHHLLCPAGSCRDQGSRVQSRGICERACRDGKPKIDKPTHTHRDTGPQDSTGPATYHPPPTTFHLPPTYKPFDVAREAAYENQISIQKQTGIWDMFAAASNQRPSLMDPPIESKGIPPLEVGHLLGHKRVFEIFANF